MKKVAVLLAAASFGLTGLLSGCSNNENFTARTYAAEGEVVSVSVDVSDRAVEIAPSADGTLRIEYYESEKQSYNISLSEAGALSVSLDLDLSWTDYIGAQAPAEYRTICIYLPHTLTAFTVSTTNEAISATGTIAADSVSMAVNGGDLSFDKISAGSSVALSAKNGNIRGTLLGGWDDYSIVCTVKKGDTNLPEQKEGGGKSLSVDCNNGNVNVGFALA